MEIEPSQDRTSTVECCLKVVSLASAPSINWTGNWEQFLHVTGIEFDIITKKRRVMARSDSVVYLKAMLSQVLN
jgi:hypothetical protein